MKIESKWVLSLLFTVVHILRYRALWNRKNTDYAFTSPQCKKFMSPKKALALIKDNDVVIVSGIAGNQRISILAWSLQEMFNEHKSPCNITLISAAGQGGRGKSPGTLEEIAIEGLIKRFICAHFETYKAFLELAKNGKIELECIPLGTLAKLVKLAANNKRTFLSSVGIGTFCDPRVGPGSAIFASRKGLISVVNDNQLEYSLPPIDVAIFNAPAADIEGNIYIKHCSTICDSKEAALAAKLNNGHVIVNIGKIVEKDPKNIFLPASSIDAIVLSPDTEQTATIKHTAPYQALTESHDGEIELPFKTIKLMNFLAGMTPLRGKPEKAMARECIKYIKSHVATGSYINIGVGIPEVVCEMLYHEKLLSQYTLFTEAGVIGGVPAPGMFFGAAITPQKIISSPEVFELADEKLEATILGFLQVDSQGNVNASKRGKDITRYVGPGGFIDLSCAARKIFFIGSWMKEGKVTIKNQTTSIKKKGKPKFIQQVDEITFCAKQALDAGKEIYYITDIGTFTLTDEGMQLIHIRQGIDLEEDILRFSPMEIHLDKNISTLKS